MIFMPVQKEGAARTLKSNPNKRECSCTFTMPIVVQLYLMVTVKIWTWICLAAVVDWDVSDKKNLIVKKKKKVQILSTLLRKKINYKTKSWRQSNSNINQIKKPGCKSICQTSFLINNLYLTRKHKQKNLPLTRVELGIISTGDQRLTD